MAPQALAQEPPVENARPDADLPPLTEMKIVRSSRTDVPDTITVETAEIPGEPTRVHDQEGAERLMRNEGVTLQWNGLEERGPIWVGVTQSGHWSLVGGQKGEADGYLDLEGFITEIGEDYFVFSGTIKMLGTPDEDRFCRDTKQWRFEVTQNRSYYRLREFEWCDGLTDYIDIYFPPSLR
ncbi:hypothetical protein EH31_16390 [Erythrobacter longus]|uniref:Uncharacterized protein n=2 Tax=Erythrobacter longus TaxID=1044 RepID=A0A074MSD3_ERYLO|nr:hypothetical protein EH31_16390 [Erythrobacter longus]